MRLIVLHDYFERPEGGGRLALTIARGLNADLAYGFKRSGHPFFEAPFPGTEHDLQVLAAIPGLRQFLLARAFQRRTTFIAPYDSALYSGFYTPLAVVHREGQCNVCYCHTPPRFLYDKRDYYLSLLPSYQRPLLSWLIAWLLPRYESAMRRMNRILTNSEHVRERIAQYLGLPATVVHPPCDLKRFSWQTDGGFFLSAARLDPLKRVDVIIEAFKGLPGQCLKIISSGPEEPRLRALAKGAPNVEFLGLVDEATYTRLLGSCRASIYIPHDEDFGMTAVESLASGKPVIAAAEGGLTEIIDAPSKGILLETVTPEALRHHIANFDRSAHASRAQLRQYAEQYSTERFLLAIRQALSTGDAGNGTL